MLFRTPSLTAEDRAVIERIDVIRRRLSYALSTPQRWDGFLRRDALARAIRGSNTIEGYDVTLDDAAAAVDHDDPVAAAPDSWAAVTGYRDALSYILRLAGDPSFKYDEGLIRGLHYMILRHVPAKRPGQWRAGPVHVVDERRGVVVYVGPDADHVPELMVALVAALGRPDDGTPTMVQAAMAHLNLAMIHPFADGNGRMARALQTLVLTQDGIVSPVFSSIEEYLGRFQDDYYAVLTEVGGGAWQPARDARPWVRFCLTAHYRCARDFLHRTKEMEIVWNAVESIRRDLDAPERVEPALVMAAFGRRLRNATYRTAAEVSFQVASKDLRRLVAAGLLEARGERRGRVYVGSNRLTAIRNAVRQPRTTENPFEPAAE